MFAIGFPKNIVKNVKMFENYVILLKFSISILIPQKKKKAVTMLEYDDCYMFFESYCKQAT